MAPDFEVEVWAGGAAGAPDLAEDLSLSDDIVRGHAQHMQMRVARPVALGVVDHHGVAVPRLMAAEDDPPIAGGVDGRALRRRQVDAAMEA